MEAKSIDKVVAAVSALLIIGIVVAIFKQLNKKTQTSVISKRGLEALQDPKKKEKIDQAIEEAKKHQMETGVWNDPLVDLS